MNMLRRIPVIGLLLAFALLVAACGGGDDAGSSETTAAPLAQTTTTEAPAATTTTTAAPVDTTTTTVAAFDLVAAVGEYESTIPDGWMAVSDIAAFKDAVEASNALVIDVREPSEYEEGHLPGAVNIPLRTLAENLDKIPTDRQVFVYCASGYRAGMATSSLRMIGYDNVLAFPPGWKGWTAAGEETTTEAFEADVVGDPGFTPELVAAVDAFLSTIPDGWMSAGDVEAVKAAIDAGAFVLDVRTEGEYAEGHIPGAVNIPLRTITANMSAIPTDTQVIVHCQSGFRAALSMPVLRVLGFDNVKAFTGSYAAWVAAGEPVEAG